MGIREDVCEVLKNQQEILECQDEMKASIAALAVAVAGIDGITFEELCKKVDAVQEVADANNGCLEELKDEILSDCLMELVEPLTNTAAVVEGDQTATNPPGSTFDVKDATGNVTGTATVQSATYDSNTNQTTFTLVNNTVPAAQLATAQTITKKRVVAKKPEKEAEKEPVAER